MSSDPSPAWLLTMQKDQYLHDKRNHCDIQSLHKGERLKHYALHFCKYVGRLARGHNEAKCVDRTLVDTLLVCLSAANTLGQKLGDVAIESPRSIQIDPLRFYADAAGRFADAAEKFDHLENFLAQARAANEDILRWICYDIQRCGVDIHIDISIRRKELAARAFYAQD